MTKDKLRILPADKGNATVILSNQQYIDKVTDHISSSGAYTKLTKDPTDSLTRKLDILLKSLITRRLINTSVKSACRVLHPRAPQLYGKPKIHKPNNPIRPIVAFYDFPLANLHKTLSNYLKPLAQNSIRLKDSKEFADSFLQNLNNKYPYHCSLDIVSLYTSCDMKRATDIINDKPPTTFHLISLHKPSTFSLIFVSTIATLSLTRTSILSMNGDMGSPLTVVMSEI